MNPDGEKESLMELKVLMDNMPKEQLDYLEMYSLVKELAKKESKTPEDIEALAKGVNFLETMAPVYEESRQSWHK